MKQRIQSLDNFINESKKTPFKFNVGTPYTMYFDTPNKYDIYRYDEDHGKWVITFMYDGKGKIDFRSSNADIDIYTRIDYEKIMYSVMKHLGIDVKSEERKDIDKYITYNT